MFWGSWWRSDSPLMLFFYAVKIRPTNVALVQVDGDDVGVLGWLVSDIEVDIFEVESC